MTVGSDLVLGEEPVHQGVGELTGYRSAGDEDPVVDGSEELVDCQFQVGVVR
jgi:hypothetical protein